MKTLLRTAMLAAAIAATLAFTTADLRAHQNTAPPKIALTAHPDATIEQATTALQIDALIEVTQAITVPATDLPHSTAITINSLAHLDSSPPASVIITVGTALLAPLGSPPLNVAHTAKEVLRH